MDTFEKCGHGPLSSLAPPLLEATTQIKSEPICKLSFYVDFSVLSLHTPPKVDFIKVRRTKSSYRNEREYDAVLTSTATEPRTTLYTGDSGVNFCKSFKLAYFTIFSPVF